jgi:hypothetical protein
MISCYLHQYLNGVIFLLYGIKSKSEPFKSKQNEKALNTWSRHSRHNDAQQA